VVTSATSRSMSSGRDRRIPESQGGGSHQHDGGGFGWLEEATHPASRGNGPDWSGALLRTPRECRWTHESPKAGIDP